MAEDVYGPGSSESVEGRPAWANASVLLAQYYDTEWGIPVTDERGVFERLSLEAFQCGLSWETVLKKRPAFREVFHNFEIEAVAGMRPDEVEALMGDARIVRNRRKILATVANARACLALREDGTTVAELVWSFLPEHTYAPRTMEDIPSSDAYSVAMSRALKKRGFAFVGPTTCFALMEAIGMHDTHLVASPRRGSSGLWNADGSGRT